MRNLIKGGTMSEFKIILGGEIDVKTLKNQIEKLNQDIKQLPPLKLNIEFDENSLIGKIEKLNEKIKQSVSEISSTINPALNKMGVGKTGNFYESTKIKYSPDKDGKLTEDSFTNTTKEKLGVGQVSQEVEKWNAISGEIIEKTRTISTNYDEKSNKIRAINEQVELYQQKLEGIVLSEEQRIEVAQRLQEIAQSENMSYEEKAHAIKLLKEETSQYSQQQKAVISQNKQEEKTKEKLNTTYNNLKDRIKNLGDTGVISKDAVTKFNNELERINQIPDPVRKQNAFRQLTTNINDSKKQVMSLGQQLKIAYEKFAVWSIATVSWYSVVRALRDVITQVVELDKALINLQLVTKSTDQEMRKMFETYRQMGDELGATLVDMSRAAEDFLRAGRSVAETNELIRASTIMSKVANMDAANSTKYLIGLMNTYRMEAHEVIQIVDKLSEVDVNAAVSTEELSIALSKSASSANLAGLSLDKFISYITTVSEVSRESAESIGTSFKTILARMQQVRIGSLLDEEGEDISRVDKVLQQYGISVMDTAGDLRNVGEVLDELASKWDGLTNAQKSEVAEQIAGIRQRNRFLILMDNYNRSLEIQEISLNSAGSAMEKYEIYNESIEAAINRQSLAWQSLAMATVESDLVKFFVNMNASIYNLVRAMGGLQKLIIPLVGLVFTLKPALAIGLVQGLKSVSFGVGKLGIRVGNLVYGLKMLKLQTKGVILTKQQLAAANAVLSKSFGLVTLAVTGLLILNAKQKQKEEERQRLLDESIRKIRDEVNGLESLKKEYLDLSQKAEKSEDDRKRLNDITEQLVKTYKLEQDAIDKLNGSYIEQGRIFDEIILKKHNEYLELNQKQYNEAQEFLKDSRANKSWIGITGLGKDTRQVRQLQEYQDLYQQDITPEELADSYLKLIERLNEMTDNDKAMKYLDKVRAEYSKLTGEIEKQREIVAEFEGKQSFVNMLGGSSDELNLFRKNLDNFNRSTLQEQIFMIEQLDNQYKNLAEKYPNQVHYLDSVAAQYTRIRDAILTTDYALDLVQKQEQLFKREYQRLQDEKKVQEELLAIEQARLDLANAKNRQVRIYREGQGFVFEADTREVGAAQKRLDDLLDSHEYQKKLEEFKQITDVYNQAILDSGSETVREFFRQQENLIDFEVAGYKDRLKILKKFLDERNQTILDSGGFDFVPTEREKQKEENNGQDSLSFKEWFMRYGQKKYANMTRALTSGDFRSSTDYEVYHTGGIVGEKNFDNNFDPQTEVIAKLQKGEYVFTQDQMKNIASGLHSKKETSNNSVVINGLNVTLPSVSDAEGFVKAIKGISLKAIQQQGSQRKG